MIAYVVNMTGEAWESVRNTWTLPRLYAMEREWKQRPPVHLLVAGFVGYKPPMDDAISQDNKEQSLEELMRIFGGMGGEVKNGIQ